VLHALIFLLFFLSGAAGLVYEVTWARSLGLVFGTSHLAVTTVLAVYMGGQALGSAIFGRRADLTDRPLRLYGLLELGIAASALAFLGLMKIYPWLYPPIVRVAEKNGFYMTAVRTGFAVAAMIIPTTLMGGTLPVLTRFVARRADGVANQLSFLYGLNTAGAVFGTLAAGFVLLRALGVTTTLLVAVGVSAAVGSAAILLQRHAKTAESVNELEQAKAGSPRPGRQGAVEDLSCKITLLGIGVSGFCAMGYEVLWTRMLTLVIGTSVYSFTVMLVAFLTGIGAGSHAFPLLQRRLRSGRAAVGAFGATQVLIGLSALAVTILMRDLPAIANGLRTILVSPDATEFGGRLIASFGVGVAFMFVPAFFMGLAFPAAGAAWSAGRRAIGTAVGRLLTANTIGAILGSLVSGFFLIYLFGIERSLQMLVLLNLGMGAVVVASLSSRRRVIVLSSVIPVIILLIRVVFPSWGRAWDQRYFATFVNNSRSVDTPEVARQKLADVDVLYYHEGVNETVSVIRSRGGEQSFIVNGRPEASTAMIDVQLQRALGHLPMLLHPDPRRVFVLGTGTGMTLGATAIHPEVKRLVLAEIEKGVLGVARTFERWNNHVLDDPRIEIVFNDGRNYLGTTREQFDVITADPIHPWSGGAGYLYTREYFRSVADRLAPGGIASQWLPLYELAVGDVKTVVRTFAESFKHTQIWLTYYDAILVGSNGPIVIDEAMLAKRMIVPAIRDDLAVVHMGTAEDLLSFFLMGAPGIQAFGEGGNLNTDDNVVLELSAPESQGVNDLAAKNVRALASVRGSLLPYIAPAVSEPERRAQIERWSRHLETSRRFDEAHVRFLLGERSSPALEQLLANLRARDPGHAPLQFLLDEKAFWERTEPALVKTIDFPVRKTGGSRGVLRISTVRQYLGRRCVLLSVVDNTRHEIYGQRYIDGEYEHLDGEVARQAGEISASLQSVAGRMSSPADGGPPSEADLSAALRREVDRAVGRISDPSKR
jgi:spermidine synthase